eukprot:Gregarina_sp_Poly_1__379@NODE_1094_length_5111_cov_363_423473_g758_i0_p3_GENE_NODE_1094_length_5111_cov_363_423473_g758_i0NODE_1094_length_5111_cov_363_423473_g758_i0_p3_ORF_typecomplete_len236_score47_30Pex24p/PF06398_11/5_3_NODE_1094_length_5111_cov_363_423473_g758_i0291998
MSDYSSYDEEEEARFHPPPGESEEDGWEFDGLDWVQFDSEDNAWVFDGEEWAVKDEEGNIYVQREDGMYMKEGDELFLQNENGEWVPRDAMKDDDFHEGGVGAPSQYGTASTFAAESKAVLPHWAAKWTQMAALALMDSKSVRFFNLSDVLGPAPGSVDVMPHGGSLFRGKAPTATEYYRTFTSFSGIGPALGDVIRQLQYMCRALLRLAPKGVPKLDLFDSTTAEAGSEFGILK